MKRPTSWVAAVTGAVLLLSAVVSEPAAADGTDGTSTPIGLETQPTVSTGAKTLLVSFDSDQADPAAAARTAVKGAADEVADATIAQVIPITADLAAVRLDTTLTADEVTKIADQAEVAEGVERVEASLPVTTQTTSDAYYSSLWNLQAGSPVGVDAESVWPTTTGSGAVIGVLDTGITAHTDLTGSSSSVVGGNVVAGYDFITDTQVAGDGNGRDSDPADPGDYCRVSSVPRSEWTWSSWHGTHVAGTIAALSNTIGVVGVAPEAKVQPIRVIGRCGGEMADIIAGIYWGAGISVWGVADNPTPADVLNLSLGGSGYCPATVQTAINQAVAAGTAVVVAAGNDSASLANSFPANCSNVIRVTASNTVGALASFSNYGTTSLPATVAAPGWNISSTVNAGTTVPTSESYAQMSGTSMAAPHVSAAIALLKQVDPTLTPAEEISILTSSAVALTGSCTTYGCGAGLLNLPAALGVLQNGTYVKSVVAPAPATPAATPTTAGPTTITVVTKPSVSGTYKVGKTLKVSKGAWSLAGVTLGYRWLRNGKTISKATKAKYKLVKADRKKKISVRVTVSAAGYTSTSVTTTAKKVK